MTTAQSSPKVLLPAITAMGWREIVRFFRQRNRVIGAVATPVVFWVMLGLGLNKTFRVGGDGAAVGDAAEGMGYLAFFFPGMVVMMVLFTAIFSTFSVIEDRREGFLQGVLASPASRLGIVLGKIVGGAAIATTQGLVLLLLWSVCFNWPGVGHLLAAIAVMFVMAMGLTGLGLLFAWRMDSTAGFHAIMNLVLLPMWFLSGAVFPVATAGPMKWVMYANPLTYGNTAFAWALQGEAAVDLPGIPTGVAIAIMVGSTLAAVVGSAMMATKPSHR